MKLNKTDKELIDIATQIALENKDLYNIRASLVTSVVLTKSGKIFKGINIKTSHSICAEQVAIGQALVCGERDIDTIVAVKMNQDGSIRVVSPCGLCRYTFDKLGFDVNVVVEDAENKSIIKVKSKELLPYPYRREQKK